MTAMLRQAELAADANELPRRSRWPVYADDEIAAVAEVLRSGRVNSLHHGDQCRRFEAQLAARCERKHGIAVSNGTLALELALHGFGIGPGDEVVVPARSFMATASCVVACGAVPVFADVDRESQNLTAESIAAAMTERTRAVIAVHLAGWPCAMEPVMALAARNSMVVIEDCAQALGARIDGREAGSFGHAAAFSFCTDKIVSTGGEGGMLLLDDTTAWKRAWAQKDHGKDPEHYAGIRPGPDFLWLHQSFGSNARMTEMQAAIGCAQLAKLDGWIAARRANVRALEAELQGLAALRLPHVPDTILHAAYKWYGFVRPERLKPGWSRRRIVETATARGLACSTGSCPEMYLEEAFAGHPSRPGERLPVARELGETSLMLQVDPTLEPRDLALAGRILRSVIEEASA